MLIKASILTFMFILLNFYLQDFNDNSINTVPSVYIL